MIKRGKILASDGIQLEGRNVIKVWIKEENSKYLGILQSKDIQRTTVEKKASVDKLHKLSKILKSKLNCVNTIEAINTWTIPVIQYNCRIIDRRQTELDALDR